MSSITIWMVGKTRMVLVLDLTKDWIFPVWDKTVVLVHRKVIGSGTNVSLISANAIFCWKRLKRMQEVRRKLQLR